MSELFLILLLFVVGLLAYVLDRLVLVSLRAASPLLRSRKHLVIKLLPVEWLRVEVNFGNSVLDSVGHDRQIEELIIYSLLLFLLLLFRSLKLTLGNFAIKFWIGLLIIVYLFGQRVLNLLLAFGWRFPCTCVAFLL